MSPGRPRVLLVVLGFVACLASMGGPRGTAGAAAAAFLLPAAASTRRRLTTTTTTTTTTAAAASSSSPNRPDLRVAIVGGGLAGLSTAWHLAGQVQRLTLFDPRPSGHAEASSVAGGLLHPLTPKNRLIWSGLEGFEATLRLLAASKEALGHHGEEAAVQRLHSAPGTIVRPALTPQHTSDYQAAATKLPEWLEWLEGTEWERAANSSGSGVLLRRSVIVSMPDYLRGLWLSTQAKHGTRTEWEARPFASDDTTAYDVVILAMGAGIRTLSQLKGLPVELVRGRTLLVEDSESTPLGAALLCGEYVVPGVDAAKSSEEKRVLRCGATREYVKDPWDTPEGKGVEEDEAKVQGLRAKAEAMYPPLKERGAAYTITSGTRVAVQRGNLGKLPIVGKVVDGKEKETWLYTGLGGRGLIHHALLGECLAQAVLRGDETLLPAPVRAPLEKRKE